MIQLKNAKLRDKESSSETREVVIDPNDESSPIEPDLIAKNPCEPVAINFTRLDVTNGV